MRVRQFIFLFLTIPALSLSQQNEQHVLNIISEIRQQYCPDRRISVFYVTPEFHGDSLILAGEVLNKAAKATLLDRLSQSTPFCIVDHIQTLPDETVGDQSFGIIRISVAQIRRNPDVNQEMINQAIMGMEIRLLKSNGYFYFCQTDDHYLGWIMRSSFIMGDQKFIETWRTKPKLIITAMHGCIYSKKSEKSTPVSQVVRGNLIIKTDSHWKWYSVELPDGRTGYIRKNIVMDYSTFKATYKPDAEQIVTTALSSIGIPYLWGGNSVNGFDCSGFTQSTYKFHGILLARDANMQVHEGKPVSLADNLSHLQPGDLLFFGRNPKKITHVGLYIGNDQFVHADGYVHTNSFNPSHDNYSEYRRQGLRAVRRIIK